VKRRSLKRGLGLPLLVAEFHCPTPAPDEIENMKSIVYIQKNVLQLKHCWPTFPSFSIEM
jgi:hypothetical protein